MTPTPTPPSTSLNVSATTITPSPSPIKKRPRAKEPKTDPKILARQRELYHKRKERQKNDPNFGKSMRKYQEEKYDAALDSVFLSSKNVVKTASILRKKLINSMKTWLLF